MAEETNLVLEMLRALRADIAEVREEQRTQGLRFGSMERHISGLHHDFSNLYQDSTDARTDFESLKARLERVERRLELNDPRQQ